MNRIKNQHKRRTEALIQAYEQAQRKPYWQVKAAVDPKVGELLIYGPIFGTQFWGDEITPGTIRDELKALGEIDTLNVYINSPGGDGYAGMAIYNILKRHSAQVVVTIDGLAASAAANIAMAGDKVVMPPNSELMIHKAWTVAMGNEIDFRHTAENLAKFDLSQVVNFAAKTGLDETQLAEMLAAETWMTAQEAVDLGFADEIEGSTQVAASADGGCLIFNGLRFDLAMFQSAAHPRFQTPPPAPQPNDPPTGERRTTLSAYERREIVRNRERRLS